MPFCLHFCSAFHVFESKGGLYVNIKLHFCFRYADIGSESGLLLATRKRPMEPDYQGVHMG